MKSAEWSVMPLARTGGMTGCATVLRAGAGARWFMLSTEGRTELTVARGEGYNNLMHQLSNYYTCHILNMSGLQTGPYILLITK